jgi:tetratricopeptide (TPR) repeat protein
MRARHALACRSLYLEALGTTGHRPDLSLRFADRMNMGGDFSRARSLYRRHLAGNPGDRDVALRLAMTLASSERYEEAEGVCRDLMVTRKDTATLTTLASVKLLEKDFRAAEGYAREALSAGPADREASRVLGEALISEGRYPEARSLYEGSTDRPAEAAQARVNIGRTYLRQKNVFEARRCFEEALAAEPGNVPARFYANWPDTVRSAVFISSLVNDTALSADDLSRWADRYLSHGLFPEAIACLKEALRRDPDFFPASISLAQALASARQYEASITLYRDLAERFPGSSKILTGLARVLAWSRRYDDSIALYREIIALDPTDPVPRREMARTAMWRRNRGSRWKPMMPLSPFPPRNRSARSTAMKRRPSTHVSGSA